MLSLTFSYLIVIPQFSDTNNYMVIVGYTPNFINFGRSVAEQSLDENVLSCVASLFFGRFYYERTARQPSTTQLQMVIAQQLIDQN